MAKESLGVINWWGFSPSIDLLSKDLIAFSPNSDVNILLVGCGDSRHILKTLSKLYSRNIKSINIFVIESSIELYARYILQLIIALVPLEKIGLQEKTELFLELYGNSLVRAQSMDFVRQMGTRLIELITDQTKCTETLPFLDLDELKFKERDILEAVFKIWRDSNPKSFDASLCWDLRVRQHLGVRYDAIPNVFDWDCSMILHDRGADIINTREYNHWRHKGVAFQLRDAHYDVSNKTLASGRVLTTWSGDKTVRLGYWGDIVCSPYLSFGIKSLNEDLFRKANHQYTSGSSQVSEYNVSSMFYELAHSKEYVELSPQTCSTIMETEENTENIVEESAPDSDYLNALIPSSTLKVTFLPINALIDSVSKKEKYCDLFDLIYFSTSLVGCLDNFKALPSRLKSTGNVIIETPQFIVNVAADQQQNFVRRLSEMCDNVGLEKNCSLSEQFSGMAHVIYNRKL